MNRRMARAFVVVWLVAILASTTLVWTACGGEGGVAATTAPSATSEAAGPAPAAVASSPAVGSPSTASSTDAPAGSTSAAPAPAALPPAIAGVPLSVWVEGDEARVEVEQLHGKMLGGGMEQAWVARYGTGQATLWVTRAADPADARDLYVRMVDRIASGGSPFTAQQPMDVPGVEGYSLEGLGQVHYYFLVGGDLYWLAIDAERASGGLLEVVGQARIFAGVE